ncbi:MAG: NUDIX domain-containing protein [Lentisphaerota bacterium]
MYCPKCGKNSFEEDSFKSFKCQKCNFRIFLNAGAAVIAIIRNDRNEVLLTIRRHDPYAGMLDLPGGFVDYEENAEEALCREIKEELNLEVVDLKYLLSIPNLYEYEGILYHTLDLAFSCKVESFDNIKTDDDVSGYKFIPIEDISLDDVGLRSAKEIVRILKEQK